MKAFAEIKQLIRLALPVSLAQLAIVGMSATDVLIAGWAGTHELAGMNLGVNTWNMIALFFMGVGLATQPLVARQFGAKSEAGVKRQLHQSIWLSFALGVICVFAVLSGAFGLQLIEFEPQIMDVAHDYLLVMSIGAIPFVLLPAVRGTLEGVSLTFPAFFVNIPLDYILVNGLFGAPKLGGVGCAWATVAVVYWMFGANLWLLKRHPKVRQQNLLSNFEPVDRAAIKKTLKLGFPIGLSIVVELSMFCGAGQFHVLYGLRTRCDHSGFPDAGRTLA